MPLRRLRFRWAVFATHPVPSVSGVDIRNAATWCPLVFLYPGAYVVERIIIALVRFQHRDEILHVRGFFSIWH